MRDVVGNLFQSRHQYSDPLQHGVEILHEPVEFVAGPGQPQPAGEIAGDDCPGIGVDRIDAIENAPCNPEPAKRSNRPRAKRAK